jgi:hypothetical protein
LRQYATSLGFTSDALTFFDRGLNFSNCWSYFLMCISHENGRTFIPDTYGILSFYENGLINIITKKVFGQTNQYNYQKTYAFFLSLIDFLIAINIKILTKKWIPSFIFILTPVSFLISGMHFQVDNVAILLMSYSFLFFINNRLSPSAILAGLSLAYKMTMMFFIPILIIYLMINRENKIKLINFCLIIGITYLILTIPSFISSYVINLSEPLSFIESIKMYLFYVLVQENSPGTLVHSFSLFGNLGFNQSLLMLIATFSSMFFLIKLKLIKKNELLAYFMIIFFIFTSRLHEQYLIIPTIGILLAWKNKPIQYINIPLQLIFISIYFRISANLDLKGNWFCNLKIINKLENIIQVYLESNIYNNIKIWIVIQLALLILIILYFLLKYSSKESHRID